MQPLERKRSLLWLVALLTCLFLGLIAATAITAPSALADGKSAHGHGSLPSGKESWGKPKFQSSGPHPNDTSANRTAKDRQPNK